MSKNIKVGDLVRIAYANPCCGYDEAVGKYFIISRIRTGGYRRGSKCKIRWSGDKIYATKSLTGGGIPIALLEKVPPLEELNKLSDRRDLKIDAPNTKIIQNA